jgi:hypothetical protein
MKRREAKRCISALGGRIIRGRKARGERYLRPLFHKNIG